MTEKRVVKQDDDEAGPESPTDLSKPSLKGVLKRGRGHFREDHLTDLAAALTYHGVLSIVPALIVLISVLGLLGQDTTTRLSPRCRRSPRAPVRGSSRR